MNIFAKFRKEISEKNKIKRMIRLFDEVKKLYPGVSHAVNMMVHNIDLKKSDKRIWRIDNDRTAHRYDKDVFDITIFGKE